MVDLDCVTMKLAAKGNTGAFKRLYDHYAPFVWRIAYRTIGSDMLEAQEVVQETFVRIHSSLKSFSGASSPGTWMYRIALNSSLDFLANRRRRLTTMVPMYTDLPGRLPGPDEYDTKEFVTSILDTLTPDDRFLLVAKELDGLTFKDLGEIYGKTSSSLRTRMSSLKKKIRLMFENEQVLKRLAA